jgi:hypothetical protein
MLVAPSYYTFTIPKNHDKGQADGDGPVFHTGSLGRIIWDGQGGMGGSAIAKEMEIGRASVYRAFG